MTKTTTTHKTVTDILYAYVRLSQNCAFVLCDAKILFPASLRIGIPEKRCCLSAKRSWSGFGTEAHFLTKDSLLLPKRGMGLNPRCITHIHREEGELLVLTANTNASPVLSHSYLQLELQRQETTSSSSRRVIKFSFSRREGIFASLPLLLPSSSRSLLPASDSRLTDSLTKTMQRRFVFPVPASLFFTGTQ